MKPLPMVFIWNPPQKQTTKRVCLYGSISTNIFFWNKSEEKNENPKKRHSLQSQYRHISLATAFTAEEHSEQTSDDKSFSEVLMEKQDKPTKTVS